MTAMQQQARRAADHPILRHLAHTLATDPRGFAPALRDWLKARSIFHPDPQGVETLYTPVEQLRQLQACGTIRGDCDDVAMLAASLAKAAGKRARYVVVGFGSPGPSAPFRHVFTEVADRGRWHAMDITRTPAAPVITRRWTREV